MESSRAQKLDVTLVDSLDAGTAAPAGQLTPGLAGTGAEAVEQVSQQRPDVVLIRAVRVVAEVTRRLLERMAVALRQRPDSHTADAALLATLTGRERVTESWPRSRHDQATTE